jgi:glycosyltransferase involved in cell wall biosynthesis
MKKSVHLVSFDIPYPPNYGGIIDVFFKIKELHKLGVEIYLHVFTVNKKNEQLILEKHCKQIFYYKRKNTFFSLFSRLPFRVESRSNKKLITNLKSLNIPIIFEGLHSAFPLTKFNFKKAYVRTHNIEHDYFFGLSKSEKNLFKKIFYYVEAKKLKKFENILNNVAGVLTISPSEQQYFSKIYGNKAVYIPVFHDAKKMKNDFKKGSFILYHGDLRVADNVRAALFLIEVYAQISYKFVIASSCKSVLVLNEVKKYKNIFFENIPSQKELEVLFINAQINTLITFQKTGIKLKLLNCLYQGKHIIANKKMIEDTGLENLCELANTKQEILEKTAKLFGKDYSDAQITARQEKLAPFYPEKNAQKMIDFIFKQ